jgi:hypothetical protein
MGALQTSGDNRILLIGDNRFLVELVSTNLRPLVTEMILLHDQDEMDAACPDEIRSNSFTLAILALSQSRNEPVVVLAQTNLTYLIGVIPLLIISDRPFPPDVKRRIFHLPFPFRANVLHKTVDDLLQQPVR